VVTPSIRLASTTEDDQVRTATPRYAIENGASQMVVGRPLTASTDPRTAVQAIAREIADVAPPQTATLAANAKIDEA
jgi:orotidine-5'-phosphate decarboxylase